MSEKLRQMQLRFKKAMKRLNEIKDMSSKSLTDEIREERDNLLEEVRGLKSDIDMEHLRIHNELQDITSRGLDINSDDNALYQRRDKPLKGYEVRGAHDSKDFRNLWGQNPRNDYRWNEKEYGCTFYEAVFSGRHHPGLNTRSMITGISSDGGFLVPVDYAEEIHNVSLENEIVMPKALVVPMTTNEKNFPGLVIGDHSSNLFGGFTASYSPEAGTLSQNNPKARNLLIKLEKLYGFLRFSNELFQDIPGSGRQITEICGKGLAWYRDKFFLKGNGAGQPQGLLNSECKIAASKETDQTADTITYMNLCEMMSRMWAGSFKNSVWIAHQTTIPQLLTLTVQVGDGGTHIPVMKESNGEFSILTRPVIFTEKTEVLGDEGDIILADLSQYIIGLREEMRIDFSPHLYFNTDEMACRLIERHEGMCLWDEALTLEDGSTTVSPVVTLEARA